MKFLTVFFFLVFLSTKASASTTTLVCTSTHSYLEVLVTVTEMSDQQFKVTLLKHDGEKIPVTSEWIEKDGEGKITKISTSGGWENFRVEHVVDNNWEGEYWDDNYPYYLVCSSK